MSDRCGGGSGGRSSSDSGIGERTDERDTCGLDVELHIMSCTVDR